MGYRTRALTLAISVAMLACGDAIVVLGDSPGILRIAAGVPDTPGDSIGDLATQTFMTTPLGLAADENGLVYISDSQNARILGITSAGVVNIFVSHQQRTEEPWIREPDGLALDGGGNLYIADPRGHRVWKLDLIDVQATVFAGTGTRGDASDGTAALLADLDTPTGIAVGPTGRVYFTEPTRNRIRRIEPDGTVTTFAGTGDPAAAGDGLTALEASFRRPTGLAFGAGALYVADTGNHKVRLIDLSNNVVSTIVGTGTRGFAGDGESSLAARLDNPRALAFTSDRLSLFIADSGNNRIRVVNLRTNTIATLAGTGMTEFNGDLLPAGQTALSSPEGIANSPLDIFYIADTGHHVVRRTAVAFLGVP